MPPDADFAKDRTLLRTITGYNTSIRVKAALLIILASLVGCAGRQTGRNQEKPVDAGSFEAVDEDARTAREDSAHPVDVAPPPPPDSPCNGYQAYCDQPYDHLCQVAAIHAAANSALYWRAPTQDLSIRGQLDRGIRVLMLEVQLLGETPMVCLSDCTEGNTGLAGVLTIVKGFLDSNAREVVTLLLDTTVPATRIAAEFSAAGLSQLAHAQPVGGAWPTLSQMIQAGHRLVVFSKTNDASVPWMLSRPAFLWETDSAWTSLTAMTCNPRSGTTTRPMYLVYQALAAGSDGGSIHATEPDADGTTGNAPETASALCAAEANDFATINSRLQSCTAQYGHAPSFVAVDFFELGDPQGAAQILNGVR